MNSSCWPRTLSPAENTLSDRDLVTLHGTENVILLDVTCELFIEEIKKLALVEEVLGHGWVDCDSPQRSQSLHQLVKRVQILLLIHLTFNELKRRSAAFFVWPTTRKIKLISKKYPN